MGPLLGERGLRRLELVDRSRLGGRPKSVGPLRFELPDSLGQRLEHQELDVGLLGEQCVEFAVTEDQQPAWCPRS